MSFRQNISQNNQAKKKGSALNPALKNHKINRPPNSSKHITAKSCFHPLLYKRKLLLQSLAFYQRESNICEFSLFLIEFITFYKQIMLFVTFELLDGRSQAKFPPFITTIDTHLLNKKVQELKKQIHDHFKPYISPFITDQNLKLSCKSAQSMINSMPLFMYIDFDQAVQYVQCSTQPKGANEEEKWKFVKNMLFYKGSKDEKLMPVSQKNQLAIEDIFQRELSDKETLMIVNGQVLAKKGQHKWYQFIEEHWKEWALQNECLYVRFFSKPPAI